MDHAECLENLEKVLRTREKLIHGREKGAVARGFHLTIDGMHLNTAGAAIVAHAILDKIRSKFPFAFGVA